MGFVELVKLMLSLMPLVIEAIKAVEVAIPQAGAGAQKLEAVISTVGAAARLAPDVVSSTSDVKHALQSGDVPNIEAGIAHMVGSVVALFNATGIFKKSGVVQALTGAQPVPDPNPQIA